MSAALKVVRAGMGAHFHLNIYEQVTLQTVTARGQGELIATTLTGENLYTSDVRGDAIWLFGNEGAGLSEAAQTLATRKITVPVSTHTESLNVAAAVAICLFEQNRQRGAIQNT